MPRTGPIGPASCEDAYEYIGRLGRRDRSRPVWRSLGEDLVDDAHLGRVGRQLGGKAVAPARLRLGAQAFAVAGVAQGCADPRHPPPTAAPKLPAARPTTR